MIPADSPAAPTTAPAIVTQIGMWVPWVVAGALWILPKIKALVTGAADTGESIWNSKRRVAKAERDFAMDELVTQIDELRKELADQKDRSKADRDQQQRQIDAHSQVIYDLRYDLSDTSAYGWQAYGEIRRLDKDTTFPKPPALRSSDADHPPIRQ